MTDAITSRVIAAIEEQYYFPPGSVNAENTFEELGIDSLSGLNLVYQLEKEFGVEVPNEQVLVIRSVKEIVSRLASLIEAEGVGDVEPSRSPR